MDLFALLEKFSFSFPLWGVGLDTDFFSKEIDLADIFLKKSWRGTY